MEVAFAGAPVTEVGERARVGAVPLQSHRHTDRVADLRRHRHADRPESGGPWVVWPAVPGPPVIPEVLDGVDAADQCGGELAERGEGPVLGSERERRAHLGGLLPLERRIDRELALALQRHALAIEPPGTDHLPKELAQLLGVEAHVRIAHGRAVGLQDADRRGAGPVRGRVHFSSWVGDAESIGDEPQR